MELKDHQIAMLINDLRDIAIEYGQTQQLRSRIAGRLLPELRKILDETELPDEAADDCRMLEAKLEAAEKQLAEAKQDSGCWLP